MILCNFFHSSGQGGENARTRGEKETREAGKWGSWEVGKQMAEERKLFINPLTPVPLVTARDEPWPFLLF